MTNSDFYLPRNVMTEERTYTEEELLAASNYVIVLAEPGAGKTELLKSLANKLNMSSMTATKLKHVALRENGQPLVIDGFDELAKIDQSGIYELFAKVIEATPSHVIISSRSSEWDNASTNVFREYLECEPLVVRLCELGDSEQRAIFENHASDEDFNKFYSEVARFDLQVLLPNPQFLKMLADAYLESDRYFPDKRSVFKLSVDRQAREANGASARNASLLSVSKKVALSSEVFAKLLLSGGEAVSTSELTEDRFSPALNSLVDSELSIYDILATRLFMPSDNPDQHRPVHKIIAEYSAANYLTERIIAPSDALTLNMCLPIIAPNAIVRDELRGLVGWMAALGNQQIQHVLIELDPYAVLANGDPSQLTPSSKQFLLSKLKEVEAQDPYFRRQDYWRRFSVAGFFTVEIVESIKPFLINGSDGQLRELILELLRGAPIAEQLKDEFRQLALAPTESARARKAANVCLLEILSYDCLPDVKKFISEASQVSLEIAAKSITSIDPNKLEFASLESFFRASANLYPTQRNIYEREVGKRYFIRQLVELLDIEVCKGLLDSLTSKLKCHCGKEAYACDCRTGISKIVALILDRYFTLATPPFDPLCIWGWVKNLNFNNRGARENKAVKILSENTELRQAILAHVFGELTDGNQILEIRMRIFSPHSHSHSGLRFIGDDIEFLVNLAFETDNPVLWASFIQYHQRHRKQEELGTDELRRYMRKQAYEKPDFMKKWATNNRIATLQNRKDSNEWVKKQNRSMRRSNKRQRDIHVANKKIIEENRKLIENGEHFELLYFFAELFLFEPDSIELKAGDPELVENALTNCLSFIEPEIPDLQELATSQCESAKLKAEVILLAACIVIMRKSGNLAGVNSLLLAALRINLRVSYPAIEEKELKALKTEVDHLLFSEIQVAEQFLRQYVEPQLTQPLCPYPEVGLLQYDEVFKELRGTLSVEWLERFEEMSFDALKTLFELAAQYGCRDKLNHIIFIRCSDFLNTHPAKTDDEKIEQKRTFWFVRAFCFLDLGVAKPFWEWLTLDKSSLLHMVGLYSRLHREDHPAWPDLTSRKIQAILEGFFEKWPKVALPNSYGTSSPFGEKAYRFLTDIVWRIGNDTPADAIPVLSHLIKNQRFEDIHDELKSNLAQQLRKSALREFAPPSPRDIVNLLDHNTVVTVEGLRQLILQELASYQKDIDGGEFNSAKRFYSKIGKDCRRLNEVDSVEIIAERLCLRLSPQSITITPEHQTKNQNRIDITAAKVINDKRKLLVIEAKGQWHKELYTAADAQLFDRYSIHPDAEHQGIYLVIWFGADEQVAGLKRHKIADAQELKEAIEKTLSPERKGLIDVFVLDVSLD